MAGAERVLIITTENAENNKLMQNAKYKMQSKK